MPKIIEYPDELMHYGRLGMKWGQHIFGDDAVSRRVRMARYALSTDYIPKGRYTSPKPVTLGQLANARRASNIYKSELIDLGKAFVQQADLSSLASSDIEMRVRMARHAMRGW